MAAGNVGSVRVNFSAPVGLAGCEEEFSVGEVPLEAGFGGSGVRVSGIADKFLGGFEGIASFVGHAKAMLFQGV